MMPPVLPRDQLVRRLRGAIGTRGRPSGGDLNLRLSDLANFTGIGKVVLYDVAHERREIDAPLQQQLSTFFSLWDARAIVKQFENGKPVLVRRRVPQAPPAPARVPPLW